MKRFEDSYVEPTRLLTKEEQADRVKTWFTSFVKDRMAPNKAGRQAILVMRTELVPLKSKIARMFRNV